MRDYLEKKIAERRERLIALDKERSTILAEMRAYEDTLQHLVADGSIGLATEEDVALPGAFEMSREWLAIMKKLWDRGQSFRAADMVRIGQDAGFDTKVPNARSQLAFYIKKGYIRRIRRGQYTITPKGQDAFNKKAPADESGGASEVTGEGDASPNDGYEDPFELR